MPAAHVHRGSYCGRNFSRPAGIPLRRMFGNAQHMTCPHCHKELPEDQKGKRCPFCGWRARRFNWLIFLCVLLLPALLTLLSAATMHFTLLNTADDSISPIIGLVGSVVGGIFCGVTLARAFTQTEGTRVALSILFAPIMIIVCLTLSCFGCALGGYNS